MPTHRPPQLPRFMRAGPFRRPVTTVRTSATADGAVLDTRIRFTQSLVDRRVLWPLLPCHPCARCSIPRDPQRAGEFHHCYRCRELRALYGHVLDGLHPITLTARDWPLVTALRALKDDLATAHDLRLVPELGAVLSSFLLARLTGPRPLFGAPHLVTTVPSSRPVIAAALARAEREGWWVPALTHVATARPGIPRQRERTGRDRLHVHDKWTVDTAVVSDRDVLVLDDLYTTGGTAHSFALALRKAGACSVRAVVLGLNVGDAARWVLPALDARHRLGLRWSPALTLREQVRR